MGGAISCGSYFDKGENNLSNNNAPNGSGPGANWKKLPSTEEARFRFTQDGTLPRDCTADHLELRALLEEPLAQHMIGQYAKKIASFNVFLCWVDIQTYKGIPTPDFRRSKAMHIYHKYIKTGGVMEIGGIDQTSQTNYESKTQLSKTNPEILTKDFFQELQIKCFMAINDNIYQRFKKSDDYSKMKAEIKQSYNRVKVDDFDYMKKLGEGGFGMVVHCRKKTTGKHYAMKIQTKKGLLDCYSDDPWRADFEKQAFASCEHPFIVNLHYAFQTEIFAIMVLGLATGKTFFSFSSYPLSSYLTFFFSPFFHFHVNLFSPPYFFG